MFGVPHVFYLFVFLKSVGIGFLLGLFYAFFDVLRTFGLNGNLNVFVQDVVFCILAFVFSFMLLFDINAGVFRFYILMGEAIGFIICLLLPVKSLRAVLQKGIRWISKKKKGGKRLRFHKKTVATKDRDDI